MIFNKNKDFYYKKIFKKKNFLTIFIIENKVLKIFNYSNYKLS